MFSPFPLCVDETRYLSRHFHRKHKALYKDIIKNSPNSNERFCADGSSVKKYSFAEGFQKMARYVKFLVGDLKPPYLARRKNPPQVPGKIVITKKSWVLLLGFPSASGYMFLGDVVIF